MRHIWICLPVALCYPALAQSLPALVGEALQNNREIVTAQKRYEAARQRPSIASSLSDPTVLLGYTSNGTPLPGGGLGTNPTSNAGISISQEVPFPGKRKLREAPMLRREQKMVERGELSTNLARVDFKLPAYFWRKQRAGVNEQVFALSEARHNYEASAQLLNARIKESYVTAQSARKLMDLYLKSVIPEANLALESSMASYETGALDAFSILTNL
jgi:outer membrane protein TolC